MARVNTALTRKRMCPISGKVSKNDSCHNHSCYIKSVNECLDTRGAALEQTFLTFVHQFGVNYTSFYTKYCPLPDCVSIYGAVTNPVLQNRIIWLPRTLRFSCLNVSSNVNSFTEASICQQWLGLLPFSQSLNLICSVMLFAVLHFPIGQMRKSDLRDSKFPSSSSS